MTAYEKIDKALKQHEKHGYYERSLESIASYLDWAWKWRKITEVEKEELIDRWLAVHDFEQRLQHGD